MRFTEVTSEVPVISWIAVSSQLLFANIRLTVLKISRTRKAAREARSWYCFSWSSASWDFLFFACIEGDIQTNTSFLWAHNWIHWTFWTIKAFTSPTTQIKFYISTADKQIDSLCMVPCKFLAHLEICGPHLPRDPASWDTCRHAQVGMSKALQPGQFDCSSAGPKD